MADREKTEMQSVMVDQPEKKSFSEAVDRFHELVDQGQPVLVGSEIAGIMRDEGFTAEQVGYAFMDTQELSFDKLFAMDGPTPRGPLGELTSLWVSDTNLNPQEQSNAIGNPRKYLVLVKWPTAANR